MNKCLEDEKRVDADRNRNQYSSRNRRNNDTGKQALRKT